MPLFEAHMWHKIALLPAVGVGATVAAYVIALRLHRWSRGHAILNPTLVAILLLAFAVKLSGLDYADYAQSAGVVTFALSPAVVLLAVPLFRQRRLIRDSARIIVGALSLGPPTGVLRVIGIAWLFHADRVTLLSLAPKSTTAGIAIGISEKIGGAPSLTAVLVIMTGITGAVIGPSRCVNCASAILALSGWPWESLRTASARPGRCRSAKPLGRLRASA